MRSAPGFVASAQSPPHSRRFAISMRAAVRGFFAALGWSALAPAAPSHATELALDWDAPPGCPSAASIRADVLRLVGAGTESRVLGAAGRVTRSATGRWRLELRTELDEVTGERTLDAGSCEALSEAAALTLALMLNPDAANGDATPEDEVAPEPAPPEAARDASTWRVELAPRVGIAVGVLPFVEPELGIGAGFASDDASVWLFGSYGPPQNASVGAELDAGGRLSMLALQGAGCWALLQGDTELAPCASVEAFRLAGRGTGVAEPEDGVITWLAAGAGLMVSAPLGPRVRLGASAFGMAPFARPRVFLDGLGEVHRPAAAALRVDGLVRVAF